MPPADTRLSYKTSLRKRKRNYSPSTTSSHSNEGLLILDGPKQNNHTRSNAQENIPDDDKVVNSLKKLGTRININEAHKQVNIKLLICTSEASYFESQEEEIDIFLKKSFGISGSSISKPVPGAIDRIFSIYGDIVSTARAAVYLAFVLNAKLNNFVISESYTLKSPNYILNLLLQGSYNDASSYSSINKTADNCELREFDISSPFDYNNNPDLISVHLKGDFSALFNFLMMVINTAPQDTINNYIDDGRINQLKIVSAYDNASLFQRQDVNKGELDKHVNKALEYVYAKSFLNPTTASGHDNE